MTSIQWTDQTWNPVVGCTPVSPGCLNCYAAAQAPRLGRMGQAQYVGLTVRKTHAASEVRDVFNGRVELVEAQLHKPLGRKKPTRYFIASMGDLFHEAVPFQFIDRVFAVMALCPQHTFQVLTKRPERMAEYLNTPGRWERIWKEADSDPCVHRLAGLSLPLPNVWLGTSAEDQTRLEERVSHLLKCPAAVRFLSCEPLLGEIDLDAAGATPCDAADIGGSFDNPEIGYVPGVDWVIVGGESGANARPCRVEWIRGVVDQCKAAGVPVFVKQLGRWPLLEEIEEPVCTTEVFRRVTGKGGEPDEWPEELRVREMPQSAACAHGGSA